ncbi:MAG: phosphopentomutase [Chlorobiaceae bacterium]|nr:phosphopentomutase [Chlorobiaceae bacterium]
MNNLFLIILDGVGVGELKDADQYGDSGSNTLANTAATVGGLTLPNLEKLGLGNIIDTLGIKRVEFPTASFGKMNELSKGKDSTSGHWEIAGIKVDFDFSYFPNGFPKEMTDLFLRETGCEGFLGNFPASGTEIIMQLGDEHVRTGFPIIYTSADSVFQIAAHEEIIPLDRLFEICKITREKVIQPPYVIGRVIARPFLGEKNNYYRTTNRHDYSIDPHKKTVLNYLSEANYETVAIGKVNDLFNLNGIKTSIPTKSNAEGCEQILRATKEKRNAFIFTNLVDFDVYYGHRNDPVGFAKTLVEFDNFLPTLLNSIDESDAIIITADHGNDPTTPSTDHSREFVPLLFFKKNSVGKNLGTRNTFSDIGKTICDFYKVPNQLDGKSFLEE